MYQIIYIELEKVHLKIRLLNYCHIFLLKLEKKSISETKSLKEFILRVDKW